MRRIATLARYAQRLGAVEIKASFYRAHRPATYARRAAGVPSDVRLSVKLPKAITHEKRLRDGADLLGDFLAQVAGLGDKLSRLLATQAH